MMFNKVTGNVPLTLTLPNPEQKGFLYDKILSLYSRPS